VDALFGAGWFELEAGNLNGAERAYRRLLALNADTPENRETCWARLGLGDIHVSRGELAPALSGYRAAQASAERATKADPGNADWQRDLSVAYNGGGDVQVAQGDLAGALRSYRDSLAIRQRLATADPGNAGWQRDLSVSFNKVGDVQVAQGDLGGA